MKKIMKDIFFKLIFNIPEKSLDLHNSLPFLPERLTIEKIEKLVPNLLDKTEYVIQIRNLKQALNHGLVFIKTFSYSD